MGNRSVKFEIRTGKPNFLVNGRSQGGGFLACQSPASPPVKQAVAVRSSGEIAAQGKHPLLEFHSGSKPLQRPPASVVFVRVIAKQSQNSSVRLWSDTLNHPQHAHAAFCSKAVKRRSIGCLQRSLASKLCNRPVRKAVNDNKNKLRACH